MPHNAALAAEIAKLPDGLDMGSFEGGDCLFEDAHGRTNIVGCYAVTPTLIGSLHHAALKALRETSRTFIAEEEISKLESWAKRIRGEIFFASKWLLCEGQAEYAILGAVAEKLGCSS